MAHPYIVVFGPPGVGKGTQAQRVAREYSIPHISTGDIFRANIQAHTELGKKAQQFMDLGQLVPDHLTISMVEDRLQRADVRLGFVLDGFPRTVSQAEALAAMTPPLLLTPLLVINIHAPDEVLLERMSGRRTCTRCKRVFHVKFNPPRFPTVCDDCGSALSQRADDKPDVIRDRQKTYHLQTEPVLSYYAQHTTVHTVDGTPSVEVVYAMIVRVIEQHLRR